MRVEQGDRVIEGPVSNCINEKDLRLTAKETDTHIVTSCFLS